jgi:hypothetical protein
MLITEQDAVAMGDQRSAPIGAAQGILWLGRHALHRSLRSDGAARCKAQAPHAVISTLFGQPCVDAAS